MNVDEVGGVQTPCLITRLIDKDGDPLPDNLYNIQEDGKFKCVNHPPKVENAIRYFIEPSYLAGRDVHGTSGYESVKVTDVIELCKLESESYDNNDIKLLITLAQDYDRVRNEMRKKANDNKQGVVK